MDMSNFDVQEVPNNSREFIFWLFNSRCIMCKRPATEINEIVPKARSKDAMEWHNRVTLCRTCHEKYHKDGVTSFKLINMIETREQFLISLGRNRYI